MGTANSPLTGLVYPAYTIRFSTTTGITYLFNLTFQNSDDQLDDDQASEVEGYLIAAATAIASQPGIDATSGSPQIVKYTEDSSVLYNFGS